MKPFYVKELHKVPWLEKDYAGESKLVLNLMSAVKLTGPPIPLNPLQARLFFGAPVAREGHIVYLLKTMFLLYLQFTIKFF